MFKSRYGFPVFLMVSVHPVPIGPLGHSFRDAIAGSGPINGHSDPVLASWSSVLFPSIPL
jgi:hypothetical protein